MDATGGRPSWMLGDPGKVIPGRLRALDYPVGQQYEFHVAMW